MKYRSVDILRKSKKTGPGFPPFRRRDPSDRATPPDFRAGLGEWRALCQMRAGCAVLGMTFVRLVEMVNGAIRGSYYTERARQAAPLRPKTVISVGCQQSHEIFVPAELQN